MEELRAALQGAERQAAVLLKHLELWRRSQQELTEQIGADRQRFDVHLGELRGALEGWRSQLAGEA